MVKTKLVVRIVVNLTWVAVIAVAAACSGGTSASTDAGAADAGSTTLTVYTYLQHGNSAAVLTSPNWIAIQDGLGVWTPATDVGGLYHATITDPAGRWGVAVQCSTTGEMQIVQATLIESNAFEVNCQDAGKGGPDLTISYAAGGTCAHAAFAGATVVGCGSPVALTVQDGPHDLVAFSHSTATGGIPGRAYVVREFAGSSQSIDFTAPTISASADSAPLVVPPTAESTHAYFLTETTILDYGVQSSGDTLATMPDGLRRSTDVNELLIRFPTSSARVFQFFKHAVAIDDSGLEALPAPQLTAISSTSAAWNQYAASGFEIEMGGWIMAVSSGWLDGAMTYAFPAADVCAAAGFPQASCLKTGGGGLYTFTAFRPVLSDTASLPDIVVARQLGAHARDGLGYASVDVSGALP